MCMVSFLKCATKETLCKVAKNLKASKIFFLGSFSNSEIIVNEPTYNVIPITYERVDAEPRHNHNQELNRQRNGRRKSRTRV